MNDWMKRGVWTIVGVAIGFGVSLLFQPQPIAATATSAGSEGTVIATGQSQNSAVEYLWLLDDRGMLTCFLMGAQGRTVNSPPLDVKQAIKGKGGKKGKYAMVTGPLYARRADFGRPVPYRIDEQCCCRLFDDERRHHPRQHALGGEKLIATMKPSWLEYHLKVVFTGSKPAEAGLQQKTTQGDATSRLAFCVS